MEKIWLDTDIGCDIDDGYALVYLLSRNDCKLEGISTVTHDSHLKAKLANLFCKSYKKDVPVFAGAFNGICGIARGGLTETHKKILEKYSKDFKYEINYKKVYDKKYANVLATITEIRNAIVENPGEITLMAIGPMTNIALLFTVYPETVPLLKKFVAMGGNFFENERCTWDISCECNIDCDIEAAKIVFNAPIPKAYIVGVDVTWDYQKSSAEVYGIMPWHEKIKPLHDITEPRLQIPNVDPIWFHDPLAAVLVFHPENFELKKGNVDVLLEDKHLGKTVFTPDRSGVWNVVSGYKGGTDKFFEHYFNVIKQ